MDVTNPLTGETILELMREFMPEKSLTIVGNLKIPLSRLALLEFIRDFIQERSFINVTNLLPGQTILELDRDNRRETLQIW